ncbi:hypothetical protein FB451DRAFT_1570149 [Mycena latifolia]|nr:hypothetical protein FB451DRAFT_1570149 [Mycena latifolia]
MHLLQALAFALGASAVPSTGPASASASAAASSSSAIGTPTNSVASPRVWRTAWASPRPRVYRAPCLLPPYSRHQPSLSPLRTPTDTDARTIYLPPALLLLALTCALTCALGTRAAFSSSTPSRKRKWQQQRNLPADQLGGAALRERSLVACRTANCSSEVAVSCCCISSPPLLPSSLPSLHSSGAADLPPCAAQKPTPPPSLNASPRAPPKRPLRVGVRRAVLRRRYPMSISSRVVHAPFLRALFRLVGPGLQFRVWSSIATTSSVPPSNAVGASPAQLRAPTGRCRTNPAGVLLLRLLHAVLL